jgi:hypothetical protein
MIALLGILADATLLALLLKGRVYWDFPVFFLYIAESLASAVAMYVLFTRASSSTYFHVYLWDLAISSLLQFALLVELSWSVLKPLRSALPKGTWIVLACVIALAGALLWPVAGLAHPAQMNATFNFFYRMQQSIAILRIGFFLILAAFSQILSIGWRNRELQIATGLGFYSLISLIVNMIHAYQNLGVHYQILDRLQTASYFGVLLFWVLSFAIKVPERKNFTPQMANFLLYLSGSAKSDRLLVTGRKVTQDDSKER